MTPVSRSISSTAGFGLIYLPASFGSMLIAPAPTAAKKPVVTALLMRYKQAAGSGQRGLPGCCRVWVQSWAPSPWEQPWSSRPRCAAHILPASPEARYANYQATASEKDSAAARGSRSSLPNRILYFELQSVRLGPLESWHQCWKRA